MLRITELIRKTVKKEKGQERHGISLIWNLTNKCNLYCRHCYSSANTSHAELSTEELISLITPLKEIGVVFCIISGGEPLLRYDLYDIARAIKEKGLKTYLSTNGLLINEENTGILKDLFEYVGISLDGEPAVHDSFRGKEGAFSASLRAIRLCMEKGIKVGLRFTLTTMTVRSLPFVFDITEREGIQKIYISHLVYSGRGSIIEDINMKAYKEAMGFIINKALYYVERDIPIDIVTGNNDADAVALLRRFAEVYPDLSEELYGRLRQWGGNKAGVRLLNINHRGEVRPDPFFYHPLGNVKEKDLVSIWSGNGMLEMLRERPRRLKGKCGHCPYIDICNGNSRARAYAVYGDYLAEDPACYI